MSKSALMARVITGVTAFVLLAGGTLAPIAISELVTEDSPFWNCATMGNRVCGTDDGHLVYYNESGTVTSTSTPVNGRPMCGTDSQCRQLHNEN